VRRLRSAPTWVRRIGRPRKVIEGTPMSAIEVPAPQGKISFDRAGIRPCWCMSLAVDSGQ
jgi:hypothetical protein